MWLWFVVVAKSLSRVSLVAVGNKDDPDSQRAETRTRRSTAGVKDMEANNLPRLVLHVEIKAYKSTAPL